MSITSEYVRGFVDGEGCFTLGISTKTGKRTAKRTQVYGVFSLSQSGEKGKEVLQLIQKFLKCGKISTQDYGDGVRQINYRLNVLSIKDHVNKIIPFFDAWTPILKFDVYMLWKEAIMIIVANYRRKLSEDSLQSLFKLKLTLEKLMPNSRSPNHRNGKWRKQRRA